VDSCLTCGVFATIDALAQGYARAAFESLSPAAAIAFNSFVGLWAACVLVFKGVARGDLDLREFLQKIAVFAVCGTALANVELFWEWVYLPAYHSMSGITVTLVSGSRAVDGVTDVTTMLAVVENEVMKALRLSKVVYDDGGIRNLGAIFWGMLLALPFLFVWGIFLAFVLEGVFKLTAITAVSPLLIASAGFGPTRGFAITGLRVILGGVLTVVFAGVAMGFTMTVLRRALDNAPVAIGGIKPDIGCVPGK
jgi:hypothetical protein